MAEEVPLAQRGCAIARVGSHPHDFAGGVAGIDVAGTVNVELNQKGRPDHAEGMKSIGEWRCGIEVCPQSGVRIADAMDGPLDLGRLGPVVLHDVNFAAARPTDAVVAQHPERRPDGLAGRNLNVGFNPAILKVKAMAADELRLEAGGEVSPTRE